MLRGVKHDLPPDFAQCVTQTFRTIHRLLDDCDRLLSRNRIFLDRTRGISKLTKRIALEALWIVWWLRIADALGRL